MAEQVTVNHSIQVRVLTGEPITKHKLYTKVSLINKIKICTTIHAPVVEWYTQQT